MKQPIWILVPCAALALVACGQKGPLYLPEHNQVVVTRPAAHTSASASSSSSSRSSSSSPR